MYTEEKPNRGGLLKEFVMRLILIIIFVLLLLWIIPWPNMDALNPLKDQIFNANIQTMKEAGITYFTTERLPKEVGDKTTLTLQKMLDLKLLVPFTDKNGKSCDVTKSYVSLEKQETEYLMKVNLKCGEEEDYILVHLGCYSYCTTDICEARKGEPKTTPTPKATSTPKPTAVTTKYTCKVVNGKYWGKNSTIVSKATYEKQCTVKPTSTPKPTPTATPRPTPTATPVPTATPTPTPTVKPVTRLFEYKKTVKTTTLAKYSDWTDWTYYPKKTNDGVVYGASDTKEVEYAGTRYTKIGTRAATYVAVQEVRNQLTYAGEKTYKVCKAYNYFADETSIYQATSDWQDTGILYRGYNPPSDTMTTRYILQGIDFSVCGDDCTNHPYFIYKQQTRTVTAHKDFTNVTAECTQVEDRSVSIYTIRTLSSIREVQKSGAEDIYANVKYYRVRTRELLTPASTT